MVKFLQYSVGLFYRPQTILRELVIDPRRVFFSFLGQVILAIVYFSGISLSIALEVIHIPKGIVLNIPAEQYYSFERYFILPVALAGTILTAGIIQLVARAWNGKGHFEDLFALLGFCMIIIAVVMGIPDFLIGPLTKIGIIAPHGFEYVGPHVFIATLWYLFLMILSVKEVERLPWSTSIILSLIGFAANGLVQFIFIR